MPDNSSPDTDSDKSLDRQIEAEQLVVDNYHWMLAVAKRMLGNAGDAEDVVQDALINAINGLDDFEHRSHLKTWLRRITINQSISRLRKLQSLSEESIDEYQPLFDQLDCRVEASWPGFSSPEELFEKGGTQAHVEKGLNSLPDSYGLIIKLRDIEGYDTREVAEFLSISENNVKIRLHRARVALKKILEPLLRGE